MDYGEKIKRLKAIERAFKRANADLAALGMRYEVVIFYPSDKGDPLLNDVFVGAKLTHRV